MGKDLRVRQGALKEVREQFRYEMERGSTKTSGAEVEWRESSTQEGRMLSSP